MGGVKRMLYDDPEPERQPRVPPARPSAVPARPAVSLWRPLETPFEMLDEDGTPYPVRLEVLPPRTPGEPIKLRAQDKHGRTHAWLDLPPALAAELAAALARAVAPPTPNA
jgi:hypothetical protein